VRTLRALLRVNVNRSNALLQDVQHTLKLLALSHQLVQTKTSARKALSTLLVEQTVSRPTTLAALHTQLVLQLRHAPKPHVTHKDARQSLAHPLQPVLIKASASLVVSTPHLPEERLNPTVQHVVLTPRVSIRMSAISSNVLHQVVQHSPQPNANNL